MLIMLGIGAFILPLIGLQFKLIMIFGEGNEWITGLVFAGVGSVLLALPGSKPKDGDGK